MGVNREHKNSVFSFLFSEENTLRELYEALEGIKLPPGAPVKINTLEDVLFKNKINDISFEIGGRLVVLIEHQSTINPNMAVRLLMYIARVYEKILGEENIYSGKKLPLPRPEFIVLYNGTAPFPDKQILRLSDSFEDASALGVPKDTPPALELTAAVYNINQGHNEEAVRRSKTLSGYSAFIARVRECEAEAAGESRRRLTKEEQKAAMAEAVRWCIAHNILKPFFEEHSSEVINMLLTEWDWEKYVEIQRREAAEEGREEGGERKALAIARNALSKGLSLDIISGITGLDTQTIQNLANQ